MLVTIDPMAEIDAILDAAVVEYRRARAAGDNATVDVLTTWIDHLLEQRLTFRPTPPARPVGP
jgi:hypothetical protein